MWSSACASLRGKPGSSARANSSMTIGRRELTSARVVDESLRDRKVRDRGRELFVVEPWNHVFAGPGCHQLGGGAGTLGRGYRDDLEARVPRAAKQVGEDLPMVFGSSLRRVDHEEAVGSAQLREELVDWGGEQCEQFELAGW